MASFSGTHKQLDSQDNKVITSVIHCAGLNGFIVQNAFFGLYISVLADIVYQHIFVYCGLKSHNIFLELVFLSQLLSVALCCVGKNAWGCLF